MNSIKLSGCGHDLKRNAFGHSGQNMAENKLAWFYCSVGASLMIVSRLLEVPVFCATIFVDYIVKYQSEIKLALELELPSISSCTQARLKLIVATATIRIITVYT